MQFFRSWLASLNFSILVLYNVFPHSAVWQLNSSQHSADIRREEVARRVWLRAGHYGGARSTLRSCAIHAWVCKEKEAVETV